MEIPFAIRMKLKGVWTAWRAITINLQRILALVNMRLDVPNALVPMTEQGWLLPMTTMKMGFAMWMRSAVVRIQMRATITMMLQTIAAIVSTPRVVTVAQAHPMDQVL